MTATIDITSVIFLGDSLSDRGRMYNRLLFNLFRMRVLSGLQGKTPSDSFTNGLPWTDHFIAALAEDFVNKELEEENDMDASDIADAIISKDPKIYDSVRECFDLGDDLKVNYKGNIFARTYVEGGLTADNFSHSSKSNKKFSLGRAITREILATLDEKRKILLEDDKQYQLSDQDKAQSLVIEWSGANDLITVSKAPTEQDANDAVDARIRNMTELIDNGYEHFVLFNLPDLSLTPRYQNKSESERLNAKNISDGFNKKLESACAELRAKNPNCTIDLFDVNEIFLDIYNNPEKYHMDKAKLKQPYVKSKDFEIKSNHTSPATGYMFWDDVHPTADIHAIIASYFYSSYKQKFNFIAPKNQTATKHDLLQTKDDFAIRLTSKH